MSTLDEIERSDLVELAEYLTRSRDHLIELIIRKNTQISILKGEVERLNEQVSTMRMLQQPVTRW